MHKTQELTKAGEGLAMYPREVEEEEKKVKGSGTINMGMMKAGRALVPIIFFIFNLAYWGSALT